METKQQNRKDVYEIVNQRIMEHLNKGVIPWRQPWADGGVPKNLVTGKPYKGINVWLLNSQGYKQNYFLTFKQVKELGGSVIRGEKSQEVIFWKWMDKENKETGKTDRVPMLRYYRVFNIEQCSGIPAEKLPPVTERNNQPLEICEKIIREMPSRPDIRHDKQKAYYDKNQDYVNLPKRETFDSSEDYYATAFHEIAHSTGHGSRLNRRELVNSHGFGSQDYAVEELTAEMTASYLSSFAGIPPKKLEKSAAYIKVWLDKKLKENRRFLVHASAEAQKATDYILNKQSPEKEAELTPAETELQKPIEKTIIPVEKDSSLPANEGVAVERGSNRMKQLGSIRSRAGAAKEVGITR